MASTYELIPVRVFTKFSPSLSTDMDDMDIKGDATKARIYAAIIDNILALVAMFIFVVLIGEYFHSLPIAVIAVGYLGYFFLSEGLWSRTPGKFFQGLVVRRMDGGRAGWKEALIRSVLRLLETNPALLGGLPAGLVVISSGRNQRLGDMAAGTVVVSDKLMWKGTETMLETDPII